MSERVPAAEVRAALAEVGAVGPFFATEPVPGAGWPRLADVDGLLTERVAAVRAALAASASVPVAAVEPRVAASIAQLGLLARVVAPLVAVAVRHGLVLDAEPDRVRWLPLRGGAYPLSFPDPVAVRPHRTELAARLAAGLRATAAPVNAATTAIARLPAALVWGNVISGVAGAVSQLGQGRALLGELLAAEPFAGTGRWEGGRFRRRSCCLIYRTGAGICGDCSLSRAGGR
jgi:FhuF 2Fe-2S C-terminal domain